MIDLTRFFSKKKYGHERGLSAAFRQWRADSHCKFLHGYSLEFEFKFGANELDERNINNGISNIMLTGIGGTEIGRAHV